MSKHAASLSVRHFVVINESQRMRPSAAYIDEVDCLALPSFSLRLPALEYTPHPCHCLNRLFFLYLVWRAPCPPSTSSIPPLHFAIIMASIHHMVTRSRARAEAEPYPRLTALQRARAAAAAAPASKCRFRCVACPDVVLYSQYGVAQHRRAEHEGELVR
jgi:hypothetical protein